jgi:hypothetical protein
MEKPSNRGPSPNRKAQLALGAKVNRKFKQPPPFPAKSLDKARPFRGKFPSHDEQ